MKTLRPYVLALLAILLPAAAHAVDVPLPPPPSGTSLQPGASSGRTYKLAVMGGFLSQEVASPTLQLDVGLVATPASWKRFELEWHLPIRVGRPKWDGMLTRTIVYPSVPPVVTEEPVGTTQDTVWLFEAIPTARLILPAAPGFSIHVEAGLGLSQTVEDHIEDQIYVGRTETRTLVFAIGFRAAIGLSYAVSDRLELLMQPFVLGSRLGAGDSNFSALWGLSYRL